MKKKLIKTLILSGFVFSQFTPVLANNVEVIEEENNNHFLNQLIHFAEEVFNVKVLEEEEEKTWYETKTVYVDEIVEVDNTKKETVELRGNLKAEVNKEEKKEEKEEKKEEVFIGEVLVDENGNRIEIEKEILEIVKERENRRFLKEDIYKTFINEDGDKIYIGQNINEVIDMLGEEYTVEEYNGYKWYKYNSEVKIAFYASENDLIRGITMLNNEYKLANTVSVNDDIDKLSEIFEGYDFTFYEDSIELTNDEQKVFVRINLRKGKIFSIFMQIR